MTDRARQLTAFRDAVEGDRYITADVVSLGGLSDFTRGWKKYDFNYETPKIAIELENNIEDFQLHLSVEKVLDNPIRDLFENKESLEEVLGREVLIYPDESFRNVSLRTSEGTDMGEGFRARFNSSQRVLFRGKSCGILRTYPTDVSRIESVLEQELIREKNSEGWMSVCIGSENRDGKTVLGAYRDDIDIDAEWSFSEDLRGSSRLSEFTERLSVVHSMDEDAEDARAWIKPIWSLEPQELVDNLFISDNQYWAICASPTEVKDEPLSHKLKRFLYPGDGKRYSFTSGLEYGNTYGESDDWCMSLG